MDEIIWSTDALQFIAGRLREASEALEQAANRFRGCCSQLRMALPESEAAYSEQLQDEMADVLRRLEAECDNAGRLSTAVQTVDEIFAETERDVAGLMEEAGSAPALQKEARASGAPGILSLRVAAGPVEDSLVTMDWLRQSADRYFSAAGRFVPLE